MGKIVSHKFGYDLSSLSEYTEQQVLPLVTRSLFESATGKLYRKQTGIKFKEVINRMDDTLIIQSGDACGFSPTGDTDFSQRVLTVGKMKINKDWCVNDLENYWMQTQLTPGSNYNGIPFEQAFTEFEAGLIAQQNEINLWQDTAATGFFDGFIEIIDSSALAINGNTGAITVGTGITEANVTTIIKAMIAVLPAALDGKPDLHFAMGWDTYKKLLNALFTANNFHYNGVESNPYKTGVFDYPTFGITIHAVHGLDGTDRIFLARTSNFVIGTDLENDDDQFMFWLADDKETVRFKVRWKLGTQVAFPDEIVEFTLVP